MATSHLAAQPITARELPARWLAAALVVGVAIVSTACGGAGSVARIVYPYPWRGPAVSLAAEAAIAAWGGRSALEIPDSIMGAAVLRPGIDGEIDYATAMTAVPGVVAAVGPLSSRATLLVAPIYAERHIPLIAATASSSRLRAAGPWVFQLAPDDEEEGAFMARFILDRVGVRRVTVFYLVADEYGIGLRAGLVQALRSRGVTPVDEVGIFEDSPFDRRVAESLRRAVPEIVVVAARSPEALAIARAVHERAPHALVLVGDAVLLDAAFVKAVGQAASVIHGVTWWRPDMADTVSRSFVRRFERSGGVRPDVVDAMVYDAIMVAARAVHDVGPDPAAVRRYLSELGAKRPAYRGVTGPISFGRDRPINLVMVHIANGAVVVGDGR
jgi:ABC-type branched-subunit amino acid transport system substrate-binding protein